MPPKSERPLRRMTLNLYESDCAALERRYGRGWTEKVRDMVSRHIGILGRPVYRYDVLTGNMVLFEEGTADDV